jgi:hypothetical protein
MPESGRLRIESLEGLSVSEAREFLQLFEEAYNGLVAFEVALGDLGDERRVLRQRPRPPSWARRSGLPESSLLVTPDDELTLFAVQMGSPGFWEFMGTLNPLEVIRQFLKDRHERRKDRAYRERIEAERGDLENAFLRNQVIQQQIQIARDLGATEQELRVLMNTYVYRPLGALGSFQDRGLVGVDSEADGGPV